MSQFTKILIVSPLADGRTWYLREEFSYDVGFKGSGNTVKVPVGFMTDFASVPRPLWWLIPRWGRYGNAAVIHDFCYWDQGRSRKQSDEIILEAMVVLGVGWFKRTLIHRTLRLFGWLGWWGNARARKGGECRVIAVPPVKSVETRRDVMRRPPDHEPES